MVLACAAKKRHILAISFMKSMIRAIAKAAGPVDEAMIHIPFPGGDLNAAKTDKPDCHVTNKDHCICTE